jgi:hypothetical protein
MSHGSAFVSPSSLSGCKSAPKRDPVRTCNDPLIYKRNFLEAGVPIGVDWDPTKLSFYALLSIAHTESAVRCRSNADSHGAIPTDSP